MKRTYQPNNRKKAKKHGFFARIKGNVLNKRRAKKRKNTIICVAISFLLNLLYFAFVSKSFRIFILSFYNLSFKHANINRLSCLFC